MEGFLALGFLIGMQHALEADHLAAVGAMIAGLPSSRRALVLRGAAWGLGHSITLFLVCSVVILLGLTLTDQVSAAMEFVVGIMLVLLGIDVIYRFRKKRVHFHVHSHDDSRPHLHAHSHGADVPQREDQHVHEHPKGLPLKALAIGLVHGAAGSAGLLVLAVAATRDPVVALGYIALFGAGSILGMATLTFVASWPLSAVEGRARWLHGCLSIGAGVLAIGLGIDVMIETGALAWTVF